MNFFSAIFFLSIIFFARAFTSFLFCHDSLSFLSSTSLRRSQLKRSLRSYHVTISLFSSLQLRLDDHSSNDHFALILSRFSFFFLFNFFFSLLTMRSLHLYSIMILLLRLLSLLQFRADDHSSDDHFTLIQSWFFFFSLLTILSHRSYSVMILLLLCHLQSLFHRVHHFSIKSIDSFFLSLVFCAKYSWVFSIVITTTKKWCLLSVIFHILALISSYSTRCRSASSIIKHCYNVFIEFRAVIARFSQL